METEAGNEGAVVAAAQAANRRIAADERLLAIDGGLLRLTRRLRDATRRLNRAPARLADVPRLIQARRELVHRAEIARITITLRPIEEIVPLLPGAGRQHWAGRLPSRVGWRYTAGYGRYVLADEEPYYVWRKGGGRVDSRYLPAVARDGRAVYCRADRQLEVPLYAVIESPAHLAAQIGPVRHDVVLPDGYYWDVDAQGLRVCCAASPRDDYHITAADVESGRPSHIIDQLLAGRATRLATAAREAASRAEAAGVYLCRADSIRAGNCPTGTDAWCAQHGLDLRRHYSALEVLDRVADTAQAGRVRLAVTAAVLRHRRESAAGVCVLRDHIAA